MNSNIRPVERVLRVVLGMFLMSLAFWGPSSVWFLLGIAPVATGINGWCPLYTLTGIGNRKMNMRTSNKIETQ